ncbi:S41 family peptidase [Flavobacterium selenitireducens]|uniref:S41 family peptidase n=1 Tax=Flavobacterium selenitireducens TaxID=2722704 RepID=UPI00168A75A9|nr:S41 family peptidase [Flavobacterium selenitireducens]MBD3582284.1 S41 family peptidase [Flavobacterium selenitireducens]
MKNNLKYLPILLFGVLALGILIGGMLNFPTRALTPKASMHKNKLDRLIDFIDNEYVDKVNTDSIVDLTVNNILEQLDPHSVYISPDEQEEVAQSMKGDFVGIGVNFYMYKDTVAVIMPVEGGPSEKAGIQPGDRILYAGKNKLFGRKLPTDSLFTKLKGAEGSSIELTVYRKSTNKTFKAKVTRDIVPIKSVDVATMINSEVGYIRINRFAETTYDEFEAGLQKLRKRGAKELVIDVRDNGGGYLEKAVEIADDFLSDKKLIVFTKNKKGRTDKTYATSGGSFENGKVYILINENSASASEILAGAIQDNDRGLIIGRRSFGKGLVQREMDFEDGSAVRLTIARYYTPTGRSIQKAYDKGKDDYFKDFDKRFESGELYEKDSIHISDTLKFKTPKGKIVYGGGGIVPDIFVGLEVEHGDEGVAYLMQSGAVSYFVFEQLDIHRSDFKGLTFGQFREKMDKDEVYYSNFRKYLLRNGLDLKIDKNRALVKRYLAAEFARQVYGEDKYFDIVLPGDAMIKAVLESTIE